MANPYRFFATSNHPIARGARYVRRQLMDFTLPSPRAVTVPARWAMEATREAYYFGSRVLVCEPLFKSYCKEVGKGVRTGSFIHYIEGRGDIVLGDNVLVDGKITIHFAARFVENPTLTIGDGTGIGHACRFTVGKAITIGNNCRIASEVVIFDSGGHPSDPETRQKGQPPKEEDVRPVTIEDNVWIGTRAIIYPGVTIGEGSVVSAGAIVVSDVAPYTIVAGNPARSVTSLRRDAPGQAEKPVQPMQQMAKQPPMKTTNSTIERVIQTIMEVGEIPRIGPDDDFYDAGLISLRALDLLMTLESTFNMTFAVDQFPLARTARALARLIGDDAIEDVSRPEGRPAAAAPKPTTSHQTAAAVSKAPIAITTRRTVTVMLDPPATEMAQEEIPKQVAFLSKEISNIRFIKQGAALEFEAPEAMGEELRQAASELATKMQRSLRQLTRKMVYTSRRVEAPEFRGSGQIEGIHRMGTGQVALEDIPLRLYRYFDRTLEAIGDPFAPKPMLTPTLIPATTLAKCDYFRSFPHIVTFTCHLPEDMGVIEQFRTRHQALETLDDHVLSDMTQPEACLSPAVCYHVYAAHRDRELPAEGVRFAVVGRCFRYESTQMTDLRRLWEFTMREIVFLGARENVLQLREKGNDLVAKYLEEHEMAGEIRTASDPFFIAPDAVAKTYFQISSETKYEISLLLPEGGRLAAGSLNYHSDFFGRAFQCNVQGAGPMHSVCIAFGLERWVYAFLTQHGHDPTKWPDVVRHSPEMEGVRASRSRPQKAASVRIEREQGPNVAEKSSEILRDAWAPPTLRYSADYMKWQLSFPGQPAQTVVAYIGDEPAGCIAVSPRRFRFRGDTQEGYLLSFLAVRPKFNGQGIGGKLYEAILSWMRDERLPGVVFVQAESPAAQRLLFKTVDRLNMKLKQLGSYPNYGFISRSHDVAAPYAVVETTSLDEAVTMIEGCHGDRVLCSALDRGLLQHYLTDPRNRKLLLLKEREAVVGAGLICSLEVVTSSRIDRVPTMDMLFMPEPTKARLEAMMQGASKAFDGTRGGLVSLPNLATLDTGVIQGAGARQTSVGYQGFVFHPVGHPFLDAEVTNLAVE